MDSPNIQTPNGKLMHREDWVSLRDYVEKLFDLNAKAIDKADKAMSDRLATMNEFRETLKDQAGKFVTRDEVQLMLKPICEDIRALRTTADKAEGKASYNSMIATALISIVALILGIIRLFSKLG